MCFKLNTLFLFYHITNFFLFKRNMSNIEFKELVFRGTYGEWLRYAAELCQPYKNGIWSENPTIVSTIQLRIQAKDFDEDKVCTRRFAFEYKVPTVTQCHCSCLHCPGAKTTYKHVAIKILAFITDLDGLVSLIGR